MTVPDQNQEIVPYDVLLPQLETELHVRDSQMTMLKARITVRDRRIAQHEQTITQQAQMIEQQARVIEGLRGHLAATQRPEQQLEQAEVQLPPPADQQSVPEVGPQGSAVASP